MLKPLLTAALLLPVAAAAQDTAAAQATAPEALARPGQAEGAEPPLPSDDLAECAAMIAVLSSRATQRIQRERLEGAASAWFARAGDVAIEEGELPEAEVWGEKVAAWAGRIGSIGALEQHKDWVEYCTAVGNRHGMAMNVDG